MILFKSMSRKILHFYCSTPRAFILCTFYYVDGQSPLQSNFILCYSCKAPGHLALNCPNTQQPSLVSSRSPPHLSSPQTKHKNMQSGDFLNIFKSWARFNFQTNPYFPTKSTTYNEPLRHATSVLLQTTLFLAQTFR